jgi:hypothetical protein
MGNINGGCKNVFKKVLISTKEIPWSPYYYNSIGYKLYRSSNTIFNNVYMNVELDLENNLVIFRDHIYNHYLRRFKITEHDTIDLGEYIYGQLSQSNIMFVKGLKKRLEKDIKRLRKLCR